MKSLEAFKAAVAASPNNPGNMALLIPVLEDLAKPAKKPAAKKAAK